MKTTLIIPIGEYDVLNSYNIWKKIIIIQRGVKARKKCPGQTEDFSFGQLTFHLTWPIGKRSYASLDQLCH